MLWIFVRKITLYNYIRESNFCAFFVHENIFTTKIVNYSTINFSQFLFQMRVASFQKFYSVKNSVHYGTLYYYVCYHVCFPLKQISLTYNIMFFLLQKTSCWRTTIRIVRSKQPLQLLTAAPALKTATRITWISSTDLKMQWTRQVLARWSFFPCCHMHNYWFLNPETRYFGAN